MNKSPHSPPMDSSSNRLTASSPLREQSAQVQPSASPKQIRRHNSCKEIDLRKVVLVREAKRALGDLSPNQGVDKSGLLILLRREARRVELEYDANELLAELMAGETAPPGKAHSETEGDLALDLHTLDDDGCVLI